MMAPFFEEVSNESNEVIFAKINVDEIESLSSEFEITSIPTLILFVEGKPINRKVGFLSKEMIIDFVK